MYKFNNITEDKMKKHESIRFSKLQKRATQANRKVGNRFHMIYQRHDQFTTVGLYDYKTKRHTISRDFELDFTDVLNEIEEMLDEVN